jgi:hypothetical protein
MQVQLIKMVNYLLNIILKKIFMIYLIHYYFMVYQKMVDIAFQMNLHIHKKKILI